jgi:hypothetical protein
VGKFEIARRHFQRSLALKPKWKVRLGLAMMTIAPRAVQRAYMQLRPPTTAETLAAQ